jgi:hypothetical protein
LVVDQEVDEMILEKKKELSFEVELKMTYYPELDKVGELIQQAIQSYILLRKIGKH